MSVGLLGNTYLEDFVILNELMYVDLIEVDDRYDREAYAKKHLTIHQQRGYRGGGGRRAEEEKGEEGRRNR